MGAPIPEMEPVENASAEALLSSLKTIDPGERRKHASVFNYWLSIRANRQFPPIRDLDPLEISDAGPWSLLLEMIGGGEDAVVRHFGQSIKGNVQVERIGEAPSPSLLSCIHAKLPIVAACREAFAFEEEFETDAGPIRCWVTLLPFSATGAWIDFVYGYVSLDGAVDSSEGTPEPVKVPEVAGTAEEVAEAVEQPAEEAPETAEQPVEAAPEAASNSEASAEETPEPFKVPLAPLDDEPEALDAQASPVEEAPESDPIVEFAPEPGPEAEPVVEFAEDEESLEDPAVIEDSPDAEPIAEREPESEPEPDQTSANKPSFSSKLLEGLASSFYGKVSQSGSGDSAETAVEAAIEPAAEAEPEPEAPVESEPEVAAEEPVEAIDEPTEIIAEPAYEVEGTLQSKLSEVRTLAEEAREAQVRSNMALYEGLSAAYDFALDAESEPEEYLRLVEAQGLKIQLRSPMKPVVKLAFDGMCDEPTIKQLEAVLAWALKHDLPRGTLAQRIQDEGGIGQILNGKAA